MDSTVFKARVTDTAVLCERTSIPRFLGFLTSAEAAIANNVLLDFGIKYSFFGGYDLAERTILCGLPEWCDDADAPITALSFHFRECDTLTHRDFLGSLMSLGLKREAVGDILVEKGRAVVFLKNEISDFVKNQIEKIGNRGVRIKEGFDEPLPLVGKLEHFSDTVSSVRLDCVVAAICSCSRNTACEMIEDARVAVNSLAVVKSTKSICSGDSITVRSKGKFIINSIDELSKKGRIILKYSKYV